MANRDNARRVVRCPRCHGLLQEPPGAPVYQCGGCGAALRAKNRSGDTQDALPGSAPPSTSGLPPPPPHRSSADVASTSSRRSTAPTPEDAGTRSSEQHGDVASTSSATPDVPSTRRQETNDMATSSDLVSHVSSGDVATSTSRRQATGTTGRPDQSAGDPVPASKQRASEKKEHGQSPTSRRGGANDNPEFRRPRGTTDDAISPGGTTEDATTFESQVDDTEKRTKIQALQLPDPARKKNHSGEPAAVQQPPQFRQGLAPKSSAQAVDPQPPSLRSRDGGKVPRSHELHQDLAPLRHKILKTVDELKGDLSQLFSRSPDLNPTTTTRATRPPRLQQGTTTASSRGAAVASVRARAAVKPGRVAAPPLRGLPSRRYRRCRADNQCCENVQPRTYGCCRCRHHHGKPECSSCRGHCGSRPSVAPRKPPAVPKEAKRRPPPPRHHCRPVLKGAPFIICSSCFQLVQVPADFAVSTNNTRLRKLRCGSCSAVLSYSYRDPARKKPHPQHEDFFDQLSTDGSEVHGGGGKCYARPDPFARFLDDFGLSSYSTTEDEQPPLHVSRNTSFDTVDGVKGVAGRLHRLMGYGSASELLLRHSPDLYESGFDERTTPDYTDRKGKGVCIDAEDDDDSDDDEDSGGVLMRSSAARGAVWPLPPGMLGKGGPGAIRIRS